jgi:TolA-binding protein
MKRAERQRLKKNDLGALTRQAQDLFTERKRELTWLAVGVVIVGAASIGYWAWHTQEQQHAHALLADAMIVQETRVGPPPAPGTAGRTFPTERERAQAAVVKFKAAADAYPSTDAGIFARYQEASTQMALGNADEAVKAYQLVIDRAGDSLYGQTARLGLAEARARSGQFDQAITTYKELAQRKDGGLPIDGILMQLGRTYRDAGRASDAKQTFNRLIEEFPDSPFNADAKRELDALKKA